MRLVTNSPLEYITWLLFSLLAVVVFIGVMFLIAWMQIKISAYKRKRASKK